MSAIACWLAVGDGQARAGQLGCGDTITADTTLHQSLVNCPNNGIVIGANGVTLNLNGHRIDGDGTPAAGCDPETEFCDIGVVNDGHDGVTVKHGSVREFLYGVFVGRARHNRVLGISSSRNIFFGFLSASARSLVRNSSGPTTSLPRGTGWACSAPIAYGSPQLVPAQRRPGIHVAFGSTHNLIKGNRLSRNADPRILMEADRNRVRRNRSFETGPGFLVGPGNRNVIARNHVSRGHGQHRDREGTRQPGRPQRRRSRPRVGHPPGNRAPLHRRRPQRRRNLALRNGDLGIEAVFSVIDRGGNKAHGNGNPLQCLNVVCG